MIPSLQFKFALICCLISILTAIFGFLFYLILDRFIDNSYVIFIISICFITIISAVSFAVGLFTLGNTLKVIKFLTIRAEHLAAGNLKDNLKDNVVIFSSDETNKLSDAFNRMSESVKTMVADLSTERNKLTAILNTMADGIVTIDAERKITLMNQAAQLLLEAPTNDVIGMSLIEIVRDNELHELISDSFNNNSIRQSQLDLLHQRKLVSVIVTPIGSDVEGILLTLHDLTRFRQLEITRKEFVANVSHELRNPLASIKSMVETLSSGGIEDAGNAKDFIDRIERDVGRMEVLVSDLLELSYLESGQVSLDLQPTNIAIIIEEIVNGFQDVGVQQNLSISIEIDQNIPLVSCDSAKVIQVFTNLMDNALRFTPAHGSISLSSNHDEKFVTLNITNTGYGIDEKHIPHLFERFYKVDRSRNDKGTGLGLAIVKHIVLAHGGDVDVKSSLGEETTFSVILPRAS